VRVLSIVFDQLSSAQNQETTGRLDISAASGKFDFFLNSRGFCADAQFALSLACCHRRRRSVWGRVVAAMGFQGVEPRGVKWLAQNLRGSGLRGELLRHLQDLCRMTGARNASFVMRQVPGLVDEDPFACDTFGDAWHERALAERYEIVDPLLISGASVTEPFDWALLPRTKIRTRRFLRDMQEFQIGKNALTCGFRGASGDRSLLTLTSDASERRWPSQKDEFLDAMGEIHPVIHRFVLRTHFEFTEQPKHALTPRERECLAHAAHGHTSKGISEVLKLTPATVNFFIDAAVKKLEATNRTHAAAKAVALGLIPPPR
jgi:DNA-binding CsgD family transcriptional regulator